MTPLTRILTKCLAKLTGRKAVAIEYSWGDVFYACAKETEFGNLIVGHFDDTITLNDDGTASALHGCVKHWVAL